MHIRIKPITRATKFTDPQVVEYPCLLIFEDGHSHSMGTAEQLRVLPISSPTKQQVEELFRDGLTPAVAALEHSRGKNVVQMADGSTNPNTRAFYYQFNKFNEAINGDLGGDKMWELIASLEKLLPGVGIAYQRPSQEKEKDMVIAIVTPLMRRVHESVSQAAEIMFVDSTSHVDLLNTSVTLMLTWSPAGALPLGVLLTDSQTERAYNQGNYLTVIILDLLHCSNHYNCLTVSYFK